MDFLSALTRKKTTAKEKLPHQTVSAKTNLSEIDGALDENEKLK